jgi:hypothetical protein
VIHLAINDLIASVPGLTAALVAVRHAVATRRRMLAHLEDHKPIYRSKPPIT